MSEEIRLTDSREGPLDLVPIDKKDEGRARNGGRGQIIDRSSVSLRGFRSRTDGSQGLPFQEYGRILGTLFPKTYV